jgi:hypothetical protein
MAAPKSVGRGHTIKQLRALRDSGWFNGDTGTEFQPEESHDELMRMETRRGEAEAERRLKALNASVGAIRKRSRGRPYIENASFRTINGKRVPFPPLTFVPF